MAQPIHHLPQHGAQLRVFISYSRRDKEAADALVVTLERAGFQVSIDRRDLPYGEEWQKELADMMRASDAVVWLVSPDSVISTWCQWELGEVVRLSKRLLPVCIRAIDPVMLPPALGKIHLLPAEGLYDPTAHAVLLTTALETDKAWLKEGTALAERARQWQAPLARGQQVDPDASALLSGAQLLRAEAWRQRQPARSPAPSQEVLDLILASRQAAVRRQRWIVAIAGAVAVGSLVLSAAAWWQRNLAVQRQQQALRNESRLLTGLASEKAARGDAVTAALLALEALPNPDDAADRPFVPEAQRSLYAALLEQREIFVFAEPQDRSISIQPGSRAGRALTISDNNTLRVYDIQGGQPPTVLRGTPDLVTQAYWSPDGKRLAVVTGTDRQRVLLWDLESRREIAHPLQVDDFVHAVSFSRDGRWFAIVANDGRARIHAADTGLAAGSFTGSTGSGITGAAFSPDARLLAIGDSSGGIEVWDWARAHRSPRFAHGAGLQMSDLKFTPDASRLLATPWDGTAQIWRLDQGPAPRRPRLLEGHRDIVLASAMSPDGSRFVTGSQDDTARLWRLPEGDPVLPPLTGHDGDVVAVSFSNDGRGVLTASHDGTARLWQAADARALAVLRGHTGLAGATYTEDGRHVVSVGGGTVRVWAVASPAEGGILSGHSGGVQGAAFSPDGSRLVTFGRDSTPLLWDVRGAQLVASLTGQRGLGVAAGFTADGAQVITVTDDGLVRRWDGRSGAPLGVPTSGLANGNGLSVLGPGADRLLVTDANGRAMLWDVRNGKPLASLVVPGATTLRKPVALAMFSADGRHLLTMGEKAHDPDADGVTVLGYDDRALLWSARTGELMGVFDGQKQSVSRAAFHPDEKGLALLLRDGTALVYSIAGQHLRMRIPPPAAANNGQQLRVLAYSPDGKLLLRSWRGTGQVFNVRDGQQTVLLDAATGDIGHLSFTPDSLGLVSYSGAAAKLWDARTGEHLATLAGHGLPITGVAMEPTGQWLATTSVDKTARLWPLLTQRQGTIERARQAVPRCLGPAEREAFHVTPRQPCWCARLNKWSPSMPASAPPSLRQAGGGDCAG